jgi:hypothetical protein
VILLTPIPRYISTRCCGDPGHHQNFVSRSLSREITTGLDIISEQLQGWGESKGIDFEILYTVGTVIGTDDLKGAQYNNRPLWAPEDPVHRVAPAYDLLGAKIGEFFQNEDGDEPLAKRPRLQSTVVTAKKPAVLLQAQPKPGWSTGELLGARGGCGRGRSGPRGQGCLAPIEGPKGGGQTLFPLVNM